MGAALCSAGITPFNLCAPTRSRGRAGAALRRLAFLATRRLLLRAVAPLPPNDKWRFALASFMNFALLIVEVTLNVFFLASLSTCVAPRGDGEVLVAGGCSYTLLLLYVTLPPAAAVLPPLLGIVAAATQSAPLMREYGVWHAASVVPVLVLLALGGAYAGQLGGVALGLPLALLCIKLVQSQLLGLLLAEVEAARPVRGWRGLLHVRTGAAERLRRGVGGAGAPGEGLAAAEGAFRVGGGLFARSSVVPLK
jgi:hypothetical protein